MQDDLNYHHLRYFWAVAREGSVARACALLHVSQPTISGQLRELEAAIGQPLLVRAGRGLRLTDTGRMVREHCERIFAAGRELSEALAGGGARTPRLTIGVVDGMPKLVVHRLLAPALALADPPRLTIVEDRPDALLGELALHQLDGVLTDAPLDRPTGGGVVVHRQLGENRTAIFAPRSRPDLLALAEGFPRSLHGAPMVLPTSDSTVRRTLDAWLAEREIVPRVVVECQDSALVKAFGAAGAGLFPGSDTVADEIADRYGAISVGRLASVRERYYWVSTKRRTDHPGVAAILRQAMR